IWIRRIWPKRPFLRAALLTGVFAPTTAVVLGCLLVAHGRASLRPDRPAPGPAEEEVYAWARRHTPPSAALLAAPGTLDPLVRAERAQVWSDSPYSTNWGYPPALIEPRRRAVMDAFAAGLSEGDFAFLRSLKRPVYRVARDG